MSDLIPAAPSAVEEVEAESASFDQQVWTAIGRVPVIKKSFALDLAKRLDAALAAHAEECTSHDDTGKELESAEAALREARHQLNNACRNASQFAEDALRKDGLLRTWLHTAEQGIDVSGTNLEELTQTELDSKEGK